MPKLNQPSPLLKIATYRLVYSLAKRCNDCSINDSLDELEQVVAFIKKDIRPNIPPNLEADFFGNFLSIYSYGFKPREERPKSHKRAVLEVIMDRKIDGLSVTSDLLVSMDLEDAHRIRGLSALDLHNFRRYNLEAFNLEDLKKFDCLKQCTDADLQIIGKNCLKLDYLSIVCSEQVTDKGLVALNKCTELRIVDVQACRNITNRGIQEFLSAHEKIEKIDFDFRCFSDEGWSVYPSITEFEDFKRNITNSDLRCIAEKLPNLVRLKIYGKLDDSAWLSTLGSLKKLTVLHFQPYEDVIIWAALKPLLRTIGANITGLHASSWGRGTIASSITQADLDFLHKFCPNIESLSFDYDAEEDGQTLVIPPFRRLSELNCSIYSNTPYDIAQLQFGVMTKLQGLRSPKLQVTTETLESMVLDNDNFPALNLISIRGVSNGYNLNRIREIVKNNNINLWIYNDG